MWYTVRLNKKLWETQTNEKYDHPGRTRPAPAPPLAADLGSADHGAGACGFITVLRAGVGLVANLFDDTAQKQEYEDKLEGLVLFDPMPFDGIENINDLTLREAAVWGCVYSIQETQGGFDNYNTDPETEQLLLPSVEVDAYLAKLLGPGFKLTHRSFDMEDMTVEFDETTQCYKIPITGTVGYYRATVVKLFKRSGKLHVTVGYIPTASAVMTASSIPPRTPPPSIWITCSSARAAAGI